MKKKAFLFILLTIIAVSSIKPVFSAQINAIKKRALEVLVVNDDSQAIPVIVKNQHTPIPTSSQPPTQTQQWEYFYQCHPNPTNENEIRGFLNDRGREGWEVVAAAGPGNLICEYFKKPKL